MTTTKPHCACLFLHTEDGGACEAHRVQRIAVPVPSGEARMVEPAKGVLWGPECHFVGMVPPVQGMKLADVPTCFDSMFCFDI